MCLVAEDCKSFLVNTLNYDIKSVPYCHSRLRGNDKKYMINVLLCVWGNL